MSDDPIGIEDGPTDGYAVSANRTPEVIGAPEQHFAWGATGMRPVERDDFGPMQYVRADALTRLSAQLAERDRSRDALLVAAQELVALRNEADGVRPLDTEADVAEIIGWRDRWSSAFDKARAAIATAQPKPKPENANDTPAIASNHRRHP